MGRQSGVLARQNPPLVGDELPQQVGVLEIQRVNGKVNLWFGPRRAHFAGGSPAAGATFLRLIRSSFARHSALGLMQLT